MTGGKTWDSIKWLYGPVLISKEAIRLWWELRDINDYRFPASKLPTQYRGRAGSRAFVAEHMYPTAELQKLTLSRFAKRNPSQVEVRQLLADYNAICYVWHRENEKLSVAKLGSQLPEGARKEDRFARYRAVGICPYQTRFSDGPALFKHLGTLRTKGIPWEEANEQLK